MAKPKHRAKGTPSPKSAKAETAGDVFEFDESQKHIIVNPLVDRVRRAEQRKNEEDDSLKVRTVFEVLMGPIMGDDWAYTKWLQRRVWTVQDGACLICGFPAEPFQSLDLSVYTLAYRFDDEAEGAKERMRELPEEKAREIRAARKAAGPFHFVNSSITETIRDIREAGIAGDLEILDGDHVRSSELVECYANRATYNAIVKDVVQKVLPWALSDSYRAMQKYRAADEREETPDYMTHLPRLNEKQRTILSVLWEHKCFNKVRGKSYVQIAQYAEGDGTDPDEYQKAGVILRDFGFIVTGKGRKASHHLTKPGVKAAKRYADALNS